MLDQIIGGLAVAAQPQNVLYCFLGVFLGNLVGVLPGIGSLTTIALLLPITFYIEPTAAVVMLAGVYYGGAYGGSIASILKNGLDRAYAREPTPDTPPIRHGNIRGTGYYH